MILTCPNCATRYLLAQEALGPNGRQVRCAKCGHEWLQRPPEEPPPPDIAIEPPAEAAPLRPGSNLPTLPARRRSAALGWALFVGVLAALVAGLYFGRERIIAAVPGAERLYALVGLVQPEEPLGLELRALRSARTTEDGTPFLVVSGEIANVGTRLREIPPIKVGLRDAERREIHNWTFALDDPMVAPGGSRSFSTRLPNPPEAARDLELSFLPAGK